MAGMQLGSKHLCFSCNSKFYDLGRADLVCPKCGANQNEAPAKVDMAAIAAKVMASAVQESEHGTGIGAPLADEMVIFGGESPSGGDAKSDKESELNADDSGNAEFDDEGDDF